MLIRSLVLALVVTATVWAMLLGDGRFIFICELHMQALKTTLFALRHDLNCASLSARRSLRWWTYEHFVMRPAYARDRAKMAVAYGIEADSRYGVSDESRWINICRYVSGYIEGLLARKLDEMFIDSWFQPVTGEQSAHRRSLRQLLRDISQHAHYQIASQTYANEHYGYPVSLWLLAQWWIDGAATGFFNDNKWIPFWWRAIGRDFGPLMFSFEIVHRVSGQLQCVVVAAEYEDAARDIFAKYYEERQWPLGDIISIEAI